MGILTSLKIDEVSYKLLSKMIVLKALFQARMLKFCFDYFVRFLSQAKLGV